MQVKRVQFEIVLIKMKMDHDALARIKMGVNVDIQRSDGKLIFVSNMFFNCTEIISEIIHSDIPIVN